MYVQYSISHNAHAFTIASTLERVELTAPSMDALVVSVSFISSTGRLVDAEALACAGRVRSLFAVLEDGF